jgi:formylglycine-generating enzyme required for sulfatase activity
LFLLFLGQQVWANNLVISSVTLTNDSTLTFNVSWDNSWNVAVAPANHDAVWLFIKKRECASNQWSHVNLSATAGHHSAASPLEVFIDGKDAGGVAKGVFIRRSAVGVGNITNASISLRMTNLIAGEYDFRVFGIEMVQVPEAAFQVGDGTSANAFKNGATTNPFPISSEGAIAVGVGAGQLTAGAFPPIALPAAYPKGFAQFYCMKYELSQGQYVDFVNLLTNDQAIARQITGAGNRLNITGTWPVVVANAPHRAMNTIAWADVLAYLDWAALRPMTELEYEKACRGIATPVADEKAWGTSLITDANVLTNDGTTTEASSSAIAAGSGIANFNNNSILGPIRCGFGAKAGTSRTESGASYYGIMEMSGNVDEFVVSTANAAGVAYTGVVGDGEITVSPAPGFANAATWPSPQASIASTTSAVGKATRGGNWSDAPAILQLSNRSGGIESNGQRLSGHGGRGVR